MTTTNDSRNGSAPVTSIDPEDLTKEQLLERLSLRERQLEQMHEALSKEQAERQAVENQLLGANMMELRGRRLADAGYDVLIQTASQNSAKLAEIGRAAQEAGQ